MKKNIDTRFLKVSAAGNRFLMADGVPPYLGAQLTQRIQQWCATPNGFSVDGCLWLERLSDQHYKWHFYNSDGSTAEMCGNAACSAVYFLHLQGHSTKNLTFETLSGKVRVEEVTDSFPLNFAISLDVPKILKTEESVVIDASTAHGMWIDSGVPHFVISRSLDQWPTDFQVERKIRNHPSFQPRGTNVTYLDESKTPARAISYERGVENYTEACGTGALAAAYFIFNKTKKNPIDIEMPGGKLKVTFADNKVILQSPVRLHGGVETYKE